MAGAVAVVGAGIVGLTVACRLQQEACEVVLLDPSADLDGPSYGNAGSLSPATVVPMALPGVMRQAACWLLSRKGPLTVEWRHLPTMAGWLRRFSAAGTEVEANRIAAALAPLLQDAPGMYRAMLGGEAASRLILQDGSLTVFRRSADWEGSAFGLSLRARNGIAWDEIAGADLPDFDPGLRRDLYRGIYFPANGHCTDPGALLRALMARFRSAGGRFVQARVVGFAVAPDGLAGLDTDGAGRIAARAAVIAAGTGSDRLARQLGDRVPLEAERGYHAMLTDTALRPRVPTMDATLKCVVSPMAGGVRVAGVAEFVRPSVPPNWARARQLAAQAYDLFPGLGGAAIREHREFWCGARPSTPDSLPVIGRSRYCRQVLHAFGHGHLGLTAAPMTAGLVADLIAGRPSMIDIAPYEASRFA